MGETLGCRAPLGLAMTGVPGGCGGHGALCGVPGYFPHFALLHAGYWVDQVVWVRRWIAAPLWARNDGNR